MQLYIEIQADDCPRAVKFYTTLFPSWSFTKPDENLPIEYHRGTLTPSNTQTAINILKRPVRAPEPAEHGTNAFVCSFPVEDEKALDELGGKVIEMGGKVAMEKFAVPGRGWHGYFIDTEGNTFGVFTTTYTE
ncbi:hypothetical protein AA313_de0205843 [Arthrobotrys entomopaga]|nr:hypothetical protein AA313_de0205843 [Arthrobotrys entomopaga]